MKHKNWEGFFFLFVCLMRRGNLRRWTVSGFSPSALLCWTKGAKDTAKMFLLSHVLWPVLVIWVSCIKRQKLNFTLKNIKCFIFSKEWKHWTQVNQKMTFTRVDMYTCYCGCNKSQSNKRPLSHHHGEKSSF